MYNKVVTVEGKEGYFFVLHFVPDMQWCHLAQMAQYGVFPETYKSGQCTTRTLRFVIDFLFTRNVCVVNRTQGCELAFPRAFGKP